MKSSSGMDLLDPAGVRLMIEKLIPLAAVVTPNVDEAAAITGLAVTNPEQMRAAAHKLHQMGASGVVVTGGHLDQAIDLLSFHLGSGSPTGNLQNATPALNFDSRHGLRLRDLRCLPFRHGTRAAGSGSAGQSLCFGGHQQCPSARGMEPAQSIISTGCISKSARLGEIPSRCTETYQDYDFLRRIPATKATIAAINHSMRQRWMASKSSTCWAE